ncbi:MAG: AAA family ATPase [Nitrospirae bacterium]|nr:AAA family ATPase [Nitrospirota bacterium]
MNVKKTKKGKEKRRQIDLRLEVKNFGPISKADVEIKPLTMFIGPNNSGKSYLAMLVRSAYIPLELNLVVNFMKSNNSADQYISNFFANSKIEPNEELTIPKKQAEKLIKKYLNKLYLFNTDIIMRLFSSHFKDLIQSYQNEFSIKIKQHKILTRLSYKKSDNKLKSNFSLKIIPKKITLKNIDNTNIGNFSDEMVININQRHNKINKNNAFNEMIHAFYFDYNLINITFYLPAERSMLMKVGKTIASEIIYKAQLAGIKDLETSKISGAEAEFLLNIINLPEKKGHFYSLASEFERELIDGEIALKFTDKPYPEIKFIFHESDIPLHRASSTVTTIAPLILYLKYLIEPGHVLIIEEPESHLDPKNQTILAKYLVRLRRAGVYIVITTHSEYLFSQLNNFLLLSKVNPEERIKKFGYKEDDYLNPDEMSAYVFEKDKKSIGFNTKKIKIDKGVMDDEFLFIHEALYKESFNLQQNLED